MVFTSFVKILEEKNSDNVPEEKSFKYIFFVVGTGFSGTVQKNFMLQGVKQSAQVRSACTLHVYN